MVQLSHLYMTTGKTIALIIYGPLLSKYILVSIYYFVGKVMSLFLMISWVFSMNQSWTDWVLLKGERASEALLSIQMEVPCLHHIHAHCEAPPMTRSMNISEDPIQAISRKINRDCVLLERKKNVVNWNQYIFHQMAET